MLSKVRTDNGEHLENARVGNYAEIMMNPPHQTSKSSKEKVLSPKETRSLKPRDKVSGLLKSEKPIDQSCTDRSSGVMENLQKGNSALLESSGNCQKPQSERKASEVEEVVKYMSNLPCYLQRKEKTTNLQEKALNFGVLDWGRLERWKYDQKQVSGRRKVRSASISETSSSFSTFGSSSRSGQSDSSSSSVGQRNQSPSLSSHPKSSAKEGHSRVSDGKLLLHDAATHDLKCDRKIDLPVVRDGLGSKMEKSRKKESDSKVATSNLKDCGGSSVHAEGKTGNIEGEFKSTEEHFHELGFQLSHLRCAADPNSYGFLSVDWSELPQHFEGAVSHHQQRSESHLRFESLEFNDQQLLEVNRMSFSEDFDDQLGGLSSGIPHSCPFPCNSKTTEWSDVKTGTPGVQDTKIPADACCLFTDAGERQIILCGSKIAKEKDPTHKPVKILVNRQSDGLDLGEAKASKEVARDSSPSRPSNVGLNRMNRSFSSKEATLRQVNSTSTATKSGSANSSREKGNASSRGKSSPLRRLLDPLLKPKASDHHHFGNSPSVSPAHHTNQTPTSTYVACKSSISGLSSSTAMPERRNINLSNSVPSYAHGPLQDERRTSSTMHAFLRLACKNGLPLYTFTFNDSDILAATKKKVCISDKDDFAWCYTFYSVHVVKKKSGGWMNQGSKGRRHEYVSNVVGQMKVSGSQHPKSTSNGSEDHVTVTEFVLFSAKLKEATYENIDFLPNNELLAIIIEVPKEKSKSLDANEQHNNICRDQSEVGLLDFLPEERDANFEAENLQNGQKVDNGRHSSVLVLLPNGIHGLPAKGDPSPLINRWKSGGSCDCGGWDVGCTLTILGNEDRQRKILSSSQACCSHYSTDQVDLFIQGAQENGHVFSLRAFKEGLYTVDFNASISLLQAFSVCISIIHSQKPAVPPALISLPDAKTTQKFTPTEDGRIKPASTRTQGEVLASYLPYPPLSPVGRV